MKTLDIRKIFGMNVKKYRKKLGLSQEQFAERLDISTSHLSVIETGTKFVTYKLLEKIILELNVMPASLFYTEGTEMFDDSKVNELNTIIKSNFDATIKNVQKKISECIWNN